MNRAYSLVVLLGISCSLIAMEHDEERGSKASLDEDKRSMQLSEVQRSVKPADLLLKVGLNKEEYKFSQLEALLNRMNISDYNVMVQKIINDNDTKNLAHAQDVLFAIVKHQSETNAHQEKLYKNALSAVRFWQRLTLAVGGGFALVMSVQAFVAALNS